jgi:hypothetical protein
MDVRKTALVGAAVAAGTVSFSPGSAATPATRGTPRVEQYFDNPFCGTDYQAVFSVTGSSGPEPADAWTYDYTCSTTSWVLVWYTDETNSGYVTGSQLAQVPSNSKTPSHSRHRVCSGGSCSEWVTLK